MLDVIYTVFIIIFQATATFIQFIYIGKLFFQKEINKKNMTFLFIIFLCFSILHFFIKNLYPLSSIIGFLTIFLISYLFLKLPFLKSIYFTIISLIISAILELCCVYLFMIILKKDSTYFASSSKINMLINLVYTFLNLIILYLLRKIRDKKNIVSPLNNKQIAIFLLMTLICILPQIFIFSINRYNYSPYYLVLNSIQMITIYYFIFIYVKRYGERETLKKELELSEIHNKTMITVIDGVRVLKHDYNNIMQALNGYVVTKQYDKLKEHLDTVLKECSDINNASVITPELFNEPAIYGIVGTKYFLATESEINFALDITTNIKEINFPFSELSRILGILLDNAIEATEKASNKYIKLEMKCDTRKNADIIKITNTFDTNCKIDLNEIYKKGVSSKEVKSGLGLWKVSNLIKKSKNAQIFPSIKNDLFTQTIKIER